MSIAYPPKISPDTEAADNPRSSRRPLRLFLLLAAIIIVGGYMLTCESLGVASITWMQVYAPEDIVGFRGLLDFLGGLRIPIPPNLSALEIAAQNLYGSPRLVTVVLYRLSLVGGFVCALAVAYPSIPRLMASFAASLLFLRATALVHPGNPQVYDVTFPFFLLLSLLLTVLASRSSPSMRWRLASSAGAGFFLSMAELLRPFGVLLLPLWILATWCLFRGQPRRLVAAFAIPLIVFSGGWHGWQIIRHGQFTISNHAGYNLIRSWAMVPSPKLEEELGNAPLRPGRLVNLNTAEHSRNSNALTKQVLKYIVAHPLQSIKHMCGRVFQIITGPTDLYFNQPRHRILLVYRVAVFCCSILLFGSVLALGIGAAVDPRSIPALLASPDNLVALTTLAMLLLMAFGECGEDTRFLVSILPLFACVPVVRLGPCRQRRRSACGCC